MPDYTLIDAHCHLDFPAFDLDREQVLQRATEQHISQIVIPGTRAADWPRISRLCRQQPNLHPCYGLHPYWTAEHAKQDIDRLGTYISEHPAVAIGECGLDFRPQLSAGENSRQNQLTFFEAQLALASDLNLPVVIHAVRATETVIQYIKKYKNISGMIHSYSGSIAQARQLVELNFYISISAAVTYDNARKIKQVAREIPLDYLLLETDAPDQPDAGHRGLRNEPAFLLQTLKVLAGLREEGEGQIAIQTSENARRLFRL